MQEEQLRQEQLSALREACKRLFPVCEEVAVAACGDGYITHEQLDNALKDMKAIQEILKITVVPYYGPDVDVVGHWHFPSPDVSHVSSDSAPHTTHFYPDPYVPDTDEVSEPNILVERCQQGFVVEVAQEVLAFTDRVDAAEWLLGWLGFEDEIVESVQDILAGLQDCDELIGRAVSWNDPEQRRPLEYERALDVVSEAWAYIESKEYADVDWRTHEQYQRLVEAVKKWRGI